MKKLLHGCIVLVLLFAFLGIPALAYREQAAALLSGDPDAVSSASLEIPDSPSGSFVVLLNRERHPDTEREWIDFFTEQPTGVIFEDLDCIVIDADSAGIELAERYRARLAENQVTVKHENGLLAVSKAQWGVFDVMILSDEIAKVYGLSEQTLLETVTVIPVEGGAA